MSSSDNSSNNNNNIGRVNSDQYNNRNQIIIEPNPRNNSTNEQFAPQFQAEEPQIIESIIQPIGHHGIKDADANNTTSQFQSFADDGDIEVVGKKAVQNQQQTKNINLGSTKMLSQRQSRSNSRDKKYQNKRGSKKGRILSFLEVGQKNELTPKSSRILYSNQQALTLASKKNIIALQQQQQQQQDGFGNNNNQDIDDDEFYDMPDQNSNMESFTSQYQSQEQSQKSQQSIIKEQQIVLNNNQPTVHVEQPQQIQQQQEQVLKYTKEDAFKLAYLTSRITEGGNKQQGQQDFNRITQRKKNLIQKENQDKIEKKSNFNTTIIFYHLLQKHNKYGVGWFNFTITLLLRMFFLFYLGYMIYQLKKQGQNSIQVYLFPIIGLFLLPRVLYSGCVVMILFYYQESPDNQERQMSTIFNSGFDQRSYQDEQAQTFQLIFNQIERPKRSTAYYTKRLWYILSFAEFSFFALTKNKKIVYLLSNYIYECIEITICGPALAIFCVVNRFFTFRLDIYTVTLSLLLIDYLFIFFSSLYIYYKGKNIIKNDKINRKQLLRLLAH